MKSSADLPNRLALDSSVFIAYFLGEKIGELAKDQIFKEDGRGVGCSHLALSEAFYVLCREESREFAQRALDTLNKTGYVTVHESAGLDYLAAGHKCQRSLSLADCYVLALAQTMHGAAVFARREKDIQEEMKRKPFEVQLLFLEDMLMNVEARKATRSYFGAERGSRPFTSKDELKSHD